MLLARENSSATNEITKSVPVARLIFLAASSNLPFSPSSAAMTFTYQYHQSCLELILFISAGCIIVGFQGLPIFFFFPFLFNKLGLTVILGHFYLFLSCLRVSKASNFPLPKDHLDTDTDFHYQKTN